MPRKRRQESPTGIYHWITRGYLKRDIFRHNEDFRKFLGLIQEYQGKYSVLIYHFCLMHNHTHLMVKAETKETLSLFSHFIKRRYAYYFSKSYNHAGPSFEKRFISIPVANEAYLLECGRYIERNPIRAGIVKDPSDYLYSSHSWYMRSLAPGMLTVSPAFLALANDPKERIARYRQYVIETRPQEEFASSFLPV